MWHVGSSFLTRDQPWEFALRAQSLSCWNTREDPTHFFEIALFIFLLGVKRSLNILNKVLWWICILPIFSLSLWLVFSIIFYVLHYTEFQHCRKYKDKNYNKKMKQKLFNVCVPNRIAKIYKINFYYNWRLQCFIHNRWQHKVLKE